MALPAAIPAALTSFWVSKALGSLFGGGQRALTPEERTAQYQAKSDWLAYTPERRKILGEMGAPLSADIGRRPAVSDLSEAAAAQTEAAQQAINRQLAVALGRLDIGAAQAGWYRSGELGEKRGEYEEAAMRDVASAAAQTALQRVGMERGYELQELQLQQQKEMADRQALVNIGTSLAPVVLEKLWPAMSSYFSKQFGGGQPSFLEQAGPGWYEVPATGPISGLPQLDIGWQPEWR